ncbi:undecaprenyl-diphosphate phosphatase [Dehalobacterium formicoaceticum]|uniref:Undecaprenyl-diphosphatase n=1 Tax=Dehalobacterium formicoaceticum TaxID=51515 RepID=A0ABT1Y8F3_9FIRM|nr:undecaprenyl-diphosphate phosphatase [Dehalobacterium formicoaceticum]MCR6547152.1 undecaprenyl-diphosphate phosphatase [Dehalobacterium formicoaceticum]
MYFIEILKAIIFGIVEGITEWLPISSTGHLILLDEFVKLDASEEFKEMFFVVIQLGAILAVVASFWKKLFPFSVERCGAIHIRKDIISLWGKILVACVPAAIIGLLFDDRIDALFYNPQTVAFTLILYGVLFIIIENRQKNREFRIRDVGGIDYKTALLIGVFQMLALIPGTSRSGATIVGALLIGVSRVAAAEFTFLLAVPVMFGASFLKMVKLGFPAAGREVAVLLVGTAVAFFVSLLAIRFLMSYIQKRSFKVFGWYRIILGTIVTLYFLI